MSGMSAALLKNRYEEMHNEEFHILPYLLNNVTAKDKLGLDMQNALGK
jgi:hypothetical protein